MIVISADVALTAAEIADGINGNNPRIGWHNLLTGDNVSAAEEDIGFPVTNLGNPITGLKWKGETLSTQYVQLTLDEAESVNYFAVAGHNFGSGGASLILQQSFDGMAWTDVSPERVPNSDHAFICEFADTEASLYYRLRIVPGSAPPEAAILYVGRILRMQRRLYVDHAPLTLNKTSDVSSGFSESGQFLGRVLRSQKLEGRAAFTNITPAWCRDTFEPFEDAAKTLPFFFAWRPEGYPNEVGYCWLRGDSELVNEQPNGMMGIKLNLQGIR